MQTNLLRRISRWALVMMGLMSCVIACRRIEENTGPVKSDRFALVYIGNVDGEIEPCG